MSYKESREGKTYEQNEYQKEILSDVAEPVRVNFVFSLFSIFDL